ncbi:MAG: NnrS family protein [Alphaproteobacteria bacterium]
MSSPSARLACGEGGAIVFQRAFRALFLAAGIYGVLAMAAWVAWLGGVHFTTGFAQASSWHAHEMLFGFTAAAVGGFLLTAVPSWTGSKPTCGPPIAALTLAWLCGRVALWTGGLGLLPSAVVAVADLAFLPGVALAVTPALVRARMWRNLVFPVLLVTLWGGQILAHLDLAGVLPGAAQAGHRLAVGAVIMMIVVIAGRIVPTFTSNWLRQQGLEGAGSLPRRVEQILFAVSAAALVGDLVAVPPVVVGGLAAVAAGLHAARLSRWRTTAVLSHPIVWVLHLGYGWLVVGFAAKALALVSPVIGETVALHAFTAGTIGTMALGVMTRAALGHSGRPLVVARSVTWAYGIVTAAAVLRVAGPALTASWGAYEVLCAGILWGIGFAIFTIVYLPILTRPRLDGQPG